MKNTRSLFLRSLLLTALLACVSCAPAIFEDEPENNPRAIFDHLWTTYDQSYGPFADRPIDWQEVYARFSPQVSETTSEEELYRIFTQMLIPFDDGHIQLNVPNKKVFYANRYYRERIEDELFQLEVVRKSYLGNTVKEEEDEYTYGLLPGDIIYLHLPYIGPNCQKIGEVLDEYPSARGIIVDLRHNEGGDFTWIFGEMGRLVDQRRLVNSSRTKNGPGRQDFTEWREWYLEPAGPRFTGKIVLLTDRYTLSAGERATMAFKALPYVTMIGDTTNGSMATMVGRELANGWKFSLPTQEVKFADGRSYEGIGLPPDIRVKNSVAELSQGKDAVLERAISEF